MTRPRLTYPDSIATVEADDCPHCDGGGRQVWGLYDTLYSDVCETCDGEGMVPA